MKKLLWLVFILPAYFSSQQLAPLTVEKIMRDQKWVGNSPSNVFWSPDSEKIYFDWNPVRATSDSLYFITLKNHHPQKATYQERSLAMSQRFGSWNNDQTKLVYTAGRTLYLMDKRTGKSTVLLQSLNGVNNPTFALKGEAIAYQQDGNLFLKNLKTGSSDQITNFQKGTTPSDKKAPETAQEKFLEEDALANSQVLRERKAVKEQRELILKAHRKSTDLKTIYTGDKQVRNISLSPDGNYVVYGLVTNPREKGTIVPNYVTQSGYTEDIPGRPVVGVPQPSFEAAVYNRQQDSIYPIKIDQIPGIRDIPKYIKENYPKEYQKLSEKPAVRLVYVSAPFWNNSGTKAFLVVRALDHKDRWIVQLNPQNGSLKLLDRQHDDAWIGGPGNGYTYSAGNVGWIDDQTIWYQSEKTGYSHLYALNVNTGESRALTSGKYEIQSAEISPDHKTFYITTNEIHPGEMQFYQLDIKSGRKTQITTRSGGNDVSVSPDGKKLAILNSTITSPWELYVQDNSTHAKDQRITDQAESAEYKSYPWRTPDIITFKDRDGLDVYAEVYRPEHPAASKPGVIFVHGAGYLQDVTKYWGPYPREHMFMNFLVDQGYTVMDIDYRGSAGYGRDWRTAIYRHMGGNDLADIADGADWMIKNLNVNPKKIGIWGGSYGGFMTLMAMFKTDKFVAGGALRSVTDWAHYNDGYTSEILNTPQEDPVAYQQSSPIYFADGLQGHLLMAHGIVDTNVHFQDIIRLNQKLIELGKKNWSLAVYPVESHGFVEPSSWTDEYNRIYKLFEQNLK